MLMLAAAPGCVSPSIVYVIALCALITGVSLGAIVGIIVMRAYQTRIRVSDPFAAPFGDMSAPPPDVDHMRGM
jgi:hypothetical protein